MASLDNDLKKKIIIKFLITRHESYHNMNKMCKTGQRDKGR